MRKSGASSELCNYDRCRAAEELAMAVRTRGQGVRRWLVAVLILGLGPLVAAACGSSGPSTAAEVCDSFTELADATGELGLLADNAVFSRAGDLGDVAVRYEESSSVMAAGEALKVIGDSDKTTDRALDEAAQPIANFCGKTSLSGYAARRRLGLE